MFRAVQILPPQQEFNRVIARSNVSLVAVGFVQCLSEEFRCDCAGVYLCSRQREGGVRDDVQRRGGVFVSGPAIGCVNIVDQTFVQRPGVQLAFPIVHDGVAETVGFGLLVGHPRRQPSCAGGLHCVGGRLCNQGIHGVDQRLGGDQTVAVRGFGDVGVCVDHVGFLYREGGGGQGQCKHRGHQAAGHTVGSF